jgi:hypothetical protein
MNWKRRLLIGLAAVVVPLVVYAVLIVVIYVIDPNLDAYSDRWTVLYGWVALHSAPSFSPLPCDPG